VQLAGTKTIGNKMAKKQDDFDHKMKMDLKEISDWIDKFDFQKEYTNNSLFMHTCMEYSNHLRRIAVYAICTIPFHRAMSFAGYNREEATIVGNIVRAYKLYDTISYHVSKGHAEIVAIMTRLLLETGGKLLYLINSTDSSKRNYILVSHKPDTYQLKDLAEKAKKRKLTTIENRILEKIERILEEDGLSKKDILNNKNWKLDGKSEEQLLSEIAYDYVYRSHSAHVHGTWLDLSIYHLKIDNGTYSPDLEYNTTNPGYITFAAVMLIDFLIEFLKWNNGDPKGVFKGLLEKLRPIIMSIDEKYEKYHHKKYLDFISKRKKTAS
jgi:hypothetical protein